MKDKFYITTPIYYTNAKPHIGHAYTTVACDILARWNRSQGKETFFLTGTDEHGAKIQKKAQEEGKEPKEFVDGIVAVFQDLWKKLDISNDGFIRTTDPEHRAAVQKVLQTLHDNGSIYKGSYKGLYCVGCEQFKSENELVDGKCPDHGAVPEEMEEECYLMKMNKWQDTLIEKIKNDEFKIQPEKYKKEILSFLEGQKLEDVSISRKNLPWGIPLPFDAEHTTYVWIDAFLNYFTGLGWDGNIESIPAMWPADLQIIGKDILRVHATIWPAMLLNLGLELPKSIFVHGHILSAGKKMSKSLGNVVDPYDMLEKFGVDGTRYLLMSAGTFGEDVDVTMERMVEKYNSDLANGLGNLVSRVVKMSQKLEIDSKELVVKIENYNKKSIDLIEINEWYECQFDKLKPEQVLYATWLGTMGMNMEKGKNISEWKLEGIKQMNEYIEKTKPWKLKENSEQLKDSMMKLYSHLNLYADLIWPFMPETSEKIKRALEEGKTEILFQRIK